MTGLQVTARRPGIEAEHPLKLPPHLGLRGGPVLRGDVALPVDAREFRNASLEIAVERRWNQFTRFALWGLGEGGGHQTDEQEEAAEVHGRGREGTRTETASTSAS